MNVVGPLGGGRAGEFVAVLVVDAGGAVPAGGTYAVQSKWLVEEMAGPPPSESGRERREEAEKQARVTAEMIASELKTGRCTVSARAIPS